MLLKLPDQPIFLIVEGMRFDRDGDDRHHYEEATCPENYLRRVLCVIQERNTDPHGLFSYLASVPIAPEDLESDRFSNMTFEEVNQLFSGLVSEYL